MIIFCRTKRRTDRIYKDLSRKLDGVGAIHGDLPQSGRNRVMSSFRGGSIRFLVATDVVGRGIDVTTVSHIVNFDMPQFCDDYVHRVGRTGRMGREGIAYSFVSQEEGDELTNIEMRIDTLPAGQNARDAVGPRTRRSRSGRSRSRRTPRDGRKDSGPVKIRPRWPRRSSSPRTVACR